MNERVGQIKSVTNRDFQSVRLWSFQLEGSDRYFRTGKVQPEVSEGQWIKFQEKNGIVLVETITMTDQPSTGQAGLTSTAQSDAMSAPRQGTAPAAPTVDVGTRIRYQAARRDASNIVIAALHTDHLPHAVNVAKGKRLDLLLQYVEEVTHSLLEQEDAA
jgi:hypothetical protein